MVIIEFVNGDSESIEPHKGTSYRYNVQSQCFEILEVNGKDIAMFPREFVKSVRVIGV